MLGQTRRRRREQGARVLVLMELQHECRANHLALVVAGHTGAFHPFAPMLDRALEEPLGRLLETGFERLAEGEREVVVAVEQERPLILDVGERDVRGQPERRRQPRILDVVGRAPRRRREAPVVVHRAAADDGAGIACERPQDSHHHRRLVRPVVEEKARGEIDQFERSRRAREDRAQDIGVLDVVVGDARDLDPVDGEGTALLTVEERAEDEARIRSRPAEPFDRAARDESDR